MRLLWAQLWAHGVAGVLPVLVLLVMAGWCLFGLYRIFHEDNG